MSTRLRDIGSAYCSRFSGALRTFITCFPRSCRRVFWTLVQRLTAAHEGDSHVQLCQLYTRVTVSRFTQKVSASTDRSARLNMCDNALRQSGVLGDTGTPSSAYTAVIGTTTVLAVSAFIFVAV
eukprot:scaffold2501_cov134-Skeletonema_dohrnii-CCMP3373.AAC.2